MYFVPDNAPREHKAICELANQGFQARRLFKAAYTFYRLELEEELREERELEVGSGLFRGMILSPDVLASQLLPKVIGTYEKEVQDYLKESVLACDNFIDIGCAEGFYLTGIARWRCIPCIGIDTDLRSKAAVDYAAAANGVSELVSFSADINEVRSFLKGSVLCLVDVDGAELQVLESLIRLCESSRSLSSVRLIVESDSSETGSQNIPEIISFLCSSGWRVDSVLRQNPSNRFVGHCSELSFLEQVVRGAEGRPGSQSWLVASKQFA